MCGCSRSLGDGWVWSTRKLSELDIYATLSSVYMQEIKTKEVNKSHSSFIKRATRHQVTCCSTKKKSQQSWRQLVFIRIALKEIKFYVLKNSVKVRISFHSFNIPVFVYWFYLSCLRAFFLPIQRTPNFLLPYTDILLSIYQNICPDLNCLKRHGQLPV